MRRIIDSHLDLAWDALAFNRDLTLPVEELRAREAHMKDEKSRGHCTLSFPELRRAGVAVCLATVLARSGTAQPKHERFARTALEHADPSLAYSVAQGQLAYYRLNETRGHMRFIRTAADLDAHWDEWNPDGAPLGIILAAEGCDPIVEPAQAEAWWNDGLRVAGPAHYGMGRYAGGTGVHVPLTERGWDLLREFSRLGMILDATHMCDESLADALDRFDGPVLASHQNCRALVPGDRQMDDGQLKRLIDRGAVIGAALDAWMLYPGWVKEVTKPEVVGLDAVADHIDHVCQIAGNADHSAIGSDLDGGFGYEQTPRDLKTISDLQKLSAILSGRGWSDGDIDKLFFGNWLRFFREHLPR